MVYPCILMKQIVVVRSESSMFLTCDHPVVLVKDLENNPSRGKGFLNSDIFFPIGRNTALILKTASDAQPLENPKESVPIYFLEVNSFAVRPVTIAICSLS